MIRNTTESWGWPARAIHWIVAVLVLGLFAQGLLMEDLPREQQLYQTWLHAAFGISLLLVAAAGFEWWLVNPVPAEPAATPAWQGHAARLAHWGLYGLIFLTTIAGWALTGAMRTPVAIELFGFIEVPQLLAPGSGYHEVLEEAHELASYLLIALAGVHVMAALYHHLVLRDGVLLRMLGRTPKPEGP